MLAEALALVDEKGERFYEAELYRLKGMLTLQKFQVSSFEFQGEQSSRSKVQGPKSSKTKSQSLHPQRRSRSVFPQSHRDCWRQQAKSLELRAVISLARLWQQQGKTESKLTRCYPRSITGSRKDLTRRTCKRRRRCWRPWGKWRNGRKENQLSSLSTKFLNGTQRVIARSQRRRSNLFFSKDCFAPLAMTGCHTCSRIKLTNH